jgi:hypothetical protein
MPRLQRSMLLPPWGSRWLLWGCSLDISFQIPTAVSVQPDILGWQHVVMEVDILMVLSTTKTALCHNSDHNLNTHHHDNLKNYVSSMYVSLWDQNTWLCYGEFKALMHTRTVRCTSHSPGVLSRSLQKFIQLRATWSWYSEISFKSFNIVNSLLFSLLTFDFQSSLPMSL